MPYQDELDTQPFRGPAERNHRDYVPATWAAPGAGGGHPKLAGGVEANKGTAIGAPRGLNRVDQRYALLPAALQARRATRAAAEYADTLVLQGPAGTYEVRTATGNRYDINADVDRDDCPDTMRLNESYPGVGLVCKHVLIVRQAIADIGAANIPWSTRKLASEIGLAPATISKKCHAGEIPATLVKLEWSIQPADAIAWMTAYSPKMIGGPIVSLP